MNNYKKLLGVVLILVMLVSSHMTIVQIVNALGPDRLLKSFSVNSGRDSGEFVVGDTLEFDVECSLVSGYRVSIYRNSSTICEVEGRVYEPVFKACVPLNPPAFNAGSVYTAVLDVYAFNYPLLGVCFADSANYVFEVVSVETQLSLIGEYDDVLHSLYLCANLTDVNNYPVVNETVGFCFQFNGGGRPTDGWVPLGVARTNSDGTALFSLAFNVPFSEPFWVRARHGGNENFGSSEKIVEVEVISNSIEGLLLAMKSSGICSNSEVLFEGNGTVIIEVSSFQPSACLLMHATGRYVSDVRLDDDLIRAMLFYCDYMNLTGFIAVGPLNLVAEGPQYVYEVNLTWSPELVGFHSLIGGVVVGNAKNVIRAMVNGTDIIASSEVSLDIQRCPSNVVLQFSEAIYGSVFPVTVAVSKPRSYQADSTAFYSVANLGPQLTYEGVSYIIDVKASSVPVRLYVNDTPAYLTTDDDGLIYYDLPINFRNVRLQAVVDDASIFFGESSEQTVAFSKVRIYDKLNVGGSNFSLSFDLSKPAGNGSYIGVASSLKSKVSLLDRCVWNVPFSVVYARIVSFFVTSSSGVATIPAGSDYLRVHNVTPLEGDVNFDNVVNAKDAVIMGVAFGSYPGHPCWNVDADINHDNIVNAKDAIVISRNFGKVGDYVLFNNGQRAYLDSQGFAVIPVGVTSLTYKKNNAPSAASIEFLQKVLNRTCLSNNLGEIIDAWAPTALGSYLVHLKLPRFFDVYLASQTAITGLDASTNLVEYFDVVKRPLDLSVSYTPEEPTVGDTVTMFASCFDTALGNPVENGTVDFDIRKGDTYIHLGQAETNSSGVATLSWNPQTYLNPPYNFTMAWFPFRVTFVETSYIQGVVVEPVWVDARVPTHLEFLGEENFKVGINETYPLRFVLTNAYNGSPIKEYFFKAYRTHNNVTSLINLGPTGDDGTFVWQWVPPDGGVYIFRVLFDQLCDWYKPSNEVHFVAVVEVIPMNILFDVQPREFRPGVNVTLTAKVLNASSNEPMVDRIVTFSFIRGDGASGTIRSIETNGSGVATLIWTYPSSGVYAFCASVAVGQQIMCSPVMLTVASETVLSLDVEMGGSSFESVISGRLLSYGDAVVGKKVKVYVNETLRAELTTGEVYGDFSLTLNLPSVDNKPTVYNVQAVFEGEDSHNASAYAYTPNGTRYAVCTTVQYGLKPSTNATMLTVDPHSTQVTHATETPEQMQQEAEQSGSLTIWHEFSWWYPWYRLHFKLNVPLPPYGTIYVDYGWSPLPLGISFQANTTVFALLLNDIGTEIATDVILGFAVGYMIQRVAAGVAGRTIVGIGVAIAAYLGYSLLSAGVLYAASGNSPKAWLAAFFSSAIGSFMDLVLQGFNDVWQWLTAISRRIVGEIGHTLNSMWARGLDFFDITGIAFTFIDFALMIGYINLYKASV